MHSQKDLLSYFHTKRCPTHGGKGKECGLRDVVHRMGRPALKQMALWADDFI